MADRVMLAGAQLRMSTETLALVDFDWATFHGTEAELAVLRNRLVTDIGFYPESAQEEILDSPWGRVMLMPRVADAPAESGRCSCRSCRSSGARAL
jgi:hypothetical protein